MQLTTQSPLPPAIAQYRAADSVFTPSNIISLMRAVMVIPAIMGIVGHLYILVAAIFIVATISDLLDGMLARRMNAVSEIGKIIDPLADKIFIGLVVITMAAYDLIPLWFLAAILGRDLIIIVAGVWGKRKLGVVLPSNYPGKAAVLAIGFSMFFTFIPGVSDSIIVFFRWVSVALMALSLFFYGTRLSVLLKASRR